MATALIQTSFAGGELSPSVFARVDLAKYHIGAARIRNSYVDYRGGTFSRAGGKFIGKAKQAFGTPPRLIPFQFSQSQTYVLEFGDSYIRFIQDGGYILETAKTITGVTKANPGVVTATSHGFANGDWVQIAGIVGMTELNGRTFVVADKTTHTFTLVDMWGNSVNTSTYTAYVSGGTASRYYTLAAPYAAADLPYVKFTQSADVMTLTINTYDIYDLARLGQTNWTITARNFSAQQAAPVAISADPSTTSPTPLAQFSYVVTAISADTGEESIASNIVSCQSVDIAQTAGSITITWDAAVGAGSYNIYKAPTGYDTTDTPVGALFGLMATTLGLQYTDGNINPDFGQTPPLHRDPFAEGQVASITMTANGSSYTSATVATINTSTGSGAILQPVIISGEVQAILIVNAGRDYAAGDTITITDGGGGTLATATLSLGFASGTQPGVTCYFQQRQYFGNSTNLPDQFWATKPGQFNNMDVSNPVRDTDAISDNISAAQVNGIQAMVPMPGGLIILTGLGAWQLTGGGQATAVTANDAEATAQAYNGCSPTVPPITINQDILYVQEKGSIVRDLSYSFFNNIYTGTDMTVLSNHLFTGYQILEWCWAEEPFKVVWAVRNDGILLSLTYLKEQEVYAWAHSDTFGLYRSICSVSESPVNAVYYVVQRYINGQWVYYVERADDRLWNTVEDVWAVDCGLQSTQIYPDATLTVSGISGEITITASSAVFTVDMEGYILRMGGGVITLDTFNNANSFTGTVTTDITSVLPNAFTMTPVPTPAAANSWSLAVPVTSVSGLEHLEGCLVSILADGSVQTPRSVVNGVVELDAQQPVSLITIGLGFQAQVQSLDVDTGNPTIQGKRKNIPALAVRVVNSRGVKLGRYFDTVTEIKQRGNSIYAGTAIPLYTGDQRMVLDQAWDVPGQVCAQQDYPLPMNILGFIPELNTGDTNG